MQPTPGLSNSRLNCIFESFRGREWRHGGRPASALGASETGDSLPRLDGLANSSRCSIRHHRSQRQRRRSRYQCGRNKKVSGTKAGALTGDLLWAVGRRRHYVKSIYRQVDVGGFV